MRDELDMLSPKEIKKMGDELTILSGKVEQTGKLMKSALDMSGSAQALEKYATILERDVNQSFEKIFGKQQKNINLEKQRLMLLEASAKAIRDGDKAQQESLKTLMLNLERVKQAKEQMPSSVTKAHGALSLMSGIMPTSGLSRALNLGQGAHGLMGGSMGSMSLAKMGMIGGGLAIAGYGASRLMGGYQTYKQQAGDVLTGYGKLGRPAMSEIDLYGSKQGYSSLERAKMVSSLSGGVRAGVVGPEAGQVVARNMAQAERQARQYGLSPEQTGGMISQFEEISGGGGALTERMMAQAVAAGVNRARISSFMEKSLHLTEQVYQATGKEGGATGINTLMAQIIKNAGDKTYAERYTAQTMGQIGEGIKAVGMGGGDIATQGFLSRAFARDTKGKQLSRYDFMARAQEGVGTEGRNIRAAIAQAGKEFKTDEQGDLAMSQMFGINFAQMKMMRTGLESGEIKPEEIQGIIDKQKEQNYIETSSEGKFMKAIAEGTSEQAKIGKSMLPLATEMVKLQTRLDAGLAGIVGFLKIEDPYTKEKRQGREIAAGTDYLGAEFEHKAKYGSAKDKGVLEAFTAMEIPDDEKIADIGHVKKMKGVGVDMVSDLKQLQAKRAKMKKDFRYTKSGTPIMRDTTEIDEQISKREKKLSTLQDVLKGQAESKESTPEMSKLLIEMGDKIAAALSGVGKTSAPKKEDAYDIKSILSGVYEAGQVKTASNMTPVNVGVNNR